MGYELGRLRHDLIATFLNDQFLKNRIVDCQSCKEHDQIAVPKSRRDVVQDAFVLLGFILIFILDADNVFLEIKTAERKPADADKNEKYVCHGLNIVFRT